LRDLPALYRRLSHGRHHRTTSPRCTPMHFVPDD
jgi:hypothetical protein